MGNHLYAFKHGGKTLGVRSIEQLVRLVETGRLTITDSVFVIQSKQWVAIKNLPEYSRFMDRGDSSTKSSPKRAKAAGSTVESACSEAMTSLIADMKESSSLLASATVIDSNPNTNMSGSGSNRTIHRIGISGERAARDRDTLIAARVPNPEGGWQAWRKTLTTAIFILLLGFGVGYLGLSNLFEENIPISKKSNILLQAQRDVPADGVSRN